jgi:hypothetical protein
MNNSLQHIIWVVGLLISQVFIIDVVDLGTYSSYFTPLIFSFIIFKRRLETSMPELLIYAFIMGFLIDVFRNTIGLNMSVMLLITIFRTRFLYLISAREDFDDNVELNLFNIGLLRYLIYFGTVLFTHHFLFFLLEQFSFVNFFALVFKSLINSIIALVLIAFLQYMFISKK